LIDGNGRQIMWAWRTDNPPDEAAKGWSGVYGLPRSLWLGEDGTLRIRPVRELDALRGPELKWGPLPLRSGEARTLEGFEGDSCELAVDLNVAGARRAGLTVRASKAGQEETRLYYDSVSKELVFDSTRSGGASRKTVERAPFALKRGERLHLRVFIDKSVVEVFANDRQAISRRVYPVRTDSLGVNLFADGDATLVTARAWTMMPSNPF
jgi:beta-fructofuranosidase